MAEGSNGPGFEIPQQHEQLENTPVEQAVEHSTEHDKPVAESQGKPQEKAKQPPKLSVPDDQTTQVAVIGDQSIQAAEPPTPVKDDLGVQKLHAKDGDLIEKEWVEKAKTVIAKTADDPHQQKNQVSQIKAAYMQKRFNKTVKTDEAAA